MHHVAIPRVDMSNRILINNSLNHILLAELTASECQLVEWLINNMDQFNNLVIDRRSDIVRKAGKSSRIVNSTIKKIRRLHLIKARTDVLMISPQLAFYGSDSGVNNKYRKLVHSYRNF